MENGVGAGLKRPGVAGWGPVDMPTLDFFLRGVGTPEDL